MEIEAKFTVPDEPTYRRLRGLHELAGFAIEPGRTVIDRDQYLDTGDGRFLAAGYACRLRREGDGYLITLKGMGGAGGAIHRRDEREARLDAAETDPGRWPEGPARSLAEEIAGDEPLQPLLALRQERAKRTVRDGAREVAEMSVDRVEAAAGEEARHGESYYELEIELKGEGADEDLERLAAPLRDEWGLSPQPHSKFERALQALRVRAGRLSGSPEAGRQQRGEESPPPPAAQPGAAPRDGPALGFSPRAAAPAPRRGFWARAFRALLPGIFARGSQPTTIPDEPFPVVREGHAGPAEPGRAQPEGNAMDEFAAGARPGPEEQEVAVDTPGPAMEDSGQPGWDGRPLDEGAPGVDAGPGREYLDGRGAPSGQTEPAVQDEAARPGGAEEAGGALPWPDNRVPSEDGEAEGSAGGREQRDEQGAPSGQIEPAVEDDAAQPGGAEVAGEASTWPDDRAPSEDLVGGEQPDEQAEGGPRAEQPGREDTQKEPAQPATAAALSDGQAGPGDVKEEAAEPAATAAPSEEQPAAQEPEPPPLRPDDPMSEAGRHIMLIHYRKMCENEEGTREGEDDEALHDMRVATRRMRAAYDIFCPYYDEKAIGRFIKGLKKTGRELGDVRDLDVLIKKAKNYQEEHADQEGFSLDPLLDAWKQRRDEARDELLNYLNSGRYEKFREDFGEFLAREGEGALQIEPGAPTPYRVCDVVPRLVMQRYEAVRAYEPVLEGAPLGTYHQLRIACKKLRYTLEFFKDVLGDPAPKLIKRVTEMQDLLGDQHDSVVAESLVAGFLAEQARQRLSEAGHASLEGAAAYLAAQWSIQRDIMARFPDMWSGIVGYEFRKNLSLAVAAL